MIKKMKKRTRKSSYVPRHAEATPGAEVTMKSTQEGGVVVSFQDGSADLHVSRRDFMRISGVAAASAALAGSACRNPVEKIVPYVDRPEETRIGLPSTYATVWENVGVLVQTRAGRPVKVEGNPEHPTSGGGLSARGLSSYMRLYDPDRAKSALKIEGESTARRSWSELDQEVINQLKGAKTGGIRLLTRTMSGSAQRALVAEILEALPNAKHYTYEAMGDEASLAANELSYGERAMPHYRFDKAEVIVSLQSDFLGTWFSATEFTKQFSKTRSPETGKMSKLIAFEGVMTLTGSNADVRYRVRPSHLPAVAMSLAHELIVKQRKGALASNGAVTTALGAFSAEAVAQTTGLPIEAIQKTAEALAAHVGKSLVVAGRTANMSADGVSLEAAVNLLNAALEADGNTIERGVRSLQTQGQFGQLKALVDEINAGKVAILIIADTNPVYSAPLELKLKEALSSGKAPLIISCNDRVDETSQYANYLAAGSHYLESWGDAMPFEGVYSIQQPVIRSLYETRPFEESLLHWFVGAGVLPKHAELLKPAPAKTGNLSGAADFETGAWYRYVRQHWEQVVYPQAKAAAGFDSFWEAVLRKGVWRSPAAAGAAPAFNAQATASALLKALPAKQERAAKDLSAKEVVLVPTVGLGDGADSNNGHLLELPDAVTKHSWGSYVMVSPKTFREAGLSNGDYVQVKRVGGERTQEYPVLMQPGMHDDVVGIPLGYGRTRAGMVANGVGENAFELSTLVAAEGKAPMHALQGFDIELTKTRKHEPLCIAQGEHSIDMQRRTFIAATTLEDFKKDPSAGIHKHPALPDLWENHNYGDLKWGLAVDLTKCTGCSACVIACQEENNTPVVGRQGIIEGREMYWMRIDRYYRLPLHKDLNKQLAQVFGDPMLKKEPYVEMSQYIEDPRVVFQPIMCQHCENAPCETVCPVLATMHSSDGINQMAYNRCVGTRYCANNCPFKVRRFNWYNYSEGRGDSVFAKLYPELKLHETNNNRAPLHMGLNPEVTVRSRGVMEKCSFCVHRIRRAKWQAKREGRLKMRDGDVTTACQQACPADAIVFGNLLDPDSAVAKLHARQNAISPLGEIGVESSVAYLTKVVNHDILDVLDNDDPHGHHGDAHGAAAAHGADGAKAAEHKGSEAHH